MKKIAIPLLIGFIAFSSCGKKNSQAATSMANEMCKAMELIKPEDPMSSIEAASAITEIAAKTEQYGDVKEEELIDAMKKVCPEGAKKYIDIYSKATESNKKDN
jgi:hypothetical protein